MKKKLLYAGLGIVVVVAIALVVVAFSLGAIVKKGVEAVGPQATKVDVTLDSAAVWLMTGGADLKGLTIGNPAKYKSRIAVQVGDVSVRINPLTVLSSKMVVDSINVKAPEITLEGGLKNNNLTEIQKNLNDYLNSGGASAPASAQAASTNAAGKKLQINDLVISGAKIHFTSLLGTGQNVTVPLPDVHLVNLGAGSDGITPPEVAEKALTALLDAAAENAGELLGKAGKDALNKVKSLDVKKAGEKLKGIFGQ
jgi:uncharacterized protein involved in outer membrane biogenesis